MEMHIDKGDYLTFGSIADGLDILDPADQAVLYNCELMPGLWRRYPNILPQDSRSDISRDGYMGVIFNAVAKKDKLCIADIIHRGWKQRWTMGSWGNFDYVNIWPLIPLLYAARYSKWIPTPPVIVPNNKKYATGYRAHLAALVVMIELMMGKKKGSHKRAAYQLVKWNPLNPWFASLAVATGVSGIESGDYHYTLACEVNSTDTGHYGWGSCPGPVFAGLVKATQQLGEWNAN